MKMRVFLPCLAVVLIIAAPITYRLLNKTPAIPILMFHKVDEFPKDPESITTQQLETFFTYLWELGFSPVNISDILNDRVDSVVPAGRKPVAITSDDSHPSMVFSRQSMPSTAELENNRSFVEILSDSLKPFDLEPRASLFLSRVWDGRISMEPGEYFGGFLPLADILALIDNTPGVDVGNHTVAHPRMANLNAADTRAILEEQRKDFEALGVLEKIVPIVAYPYGQRPSLEGMEEMRSMGFWGAVVTSEARRWYRSVPVCGYDGALLSDRFTLPRASIGAYAYPPRVSETNPTYIKTDPVAVFQSDVLNVIPLIYSVPE